MAGIEGEEGVDPREILPMEMWSAIFNRCSGPELASFYAANVTWRNFLEEQKLMFLPGRFAKVFSIVDNAVHFSGRDLLRFRLVCRGWKDGIDRYLQEHPSHLDIGFENVRPFPTPFLPIRQFDTLPVFNAIGFIIRARMNPDWDPFFSKTVRYLENVAPVYSNVAIPSQRHLFQSVLEINNYGARIHHATFKFNLINRDFPEFYEQLHSFLSRLPNLKSLWVKIEVGLDDPHKTKPEWEELLTSQPLPALNHLIFLGLKNVPQPLVMGLLSKLKNQLKRFSFQNNTGKRPSFPPGFVQDLELNNLEQFQTFAYSKQDILDVQTRAGVWPITHLNLRWIQDPDLNFLFRAVSAFSGSLKKLKLEFREVKHHNFQGVRDTLQLAQLEFIKITALQSHLSSIDFLLPCGALKELQFEMWIPFSVVPGDGPAFAGAAAPQSIQFGGWVEPASLYRSNIWTVLGQLQKIKIETVTGGPGIPPIALHNKFDFTRAGFEKFPRAVAENNE